MKKPLEFELTYSGYFDSKFLFGYKNGFITKERILTDYEIELFPENEGVTFLDGVSHKISSGSVLVGKPGQKRHSILNFKNYYIHLRIENCCLKQYIDSLPDFFKIQETELCTEILLKLIDLHHKDFPEKNLCVGKYLYDLVYLLNNNSVSHSHTYASNKSNLERARTFIKKNYTAPIQLKEIADSVNLSPIYFHKLYKEYYGESPTDYLHRVRLSKAKSLLLTTNYSAEKIASLCGFSSQSYFNYFFKKKVNMSPLQFRKKAHLEYEI